MADLNKYVQTNTFYLAGSGSIIGATSIALTSFTDIYGNVLTMTDFGTTGYITLEPDTTNEESATFTGVTANANGTYTLTGIKTTLAKDPYTQTSALVRQHSGGTKVVVSDTVAFWATFANKANDETITGVWSVPTGGTGTQVANATDIANAVIGASGTATNLVFGTVKLSVAAASAPDPISVGDNDGRVPTQSENDALVGTSGTPSSTNLYVTNDDTATAATASKVARRLAGGNITVVTESQANNSTNAASTAYVDTGLAGVTIACKTGSTTKDMSANTTTTIAHGLGRTPKLTKITVNHVQTSNASVVGTSPLSIGAFDGTTQWSNFTSSTSNGGAWLSGRDTTHGVHYGFGTTSGTADADQNIGVVSVDGTNITITWTITGTPTGTGNIGWEVIG